MFLGWYDPDKKIPARYKLADALERYARKFGRPAQTCITSPEDAAELEADKETPAMPVRGVGFIPRYTFYVGIDDVAEEVVRPVAGKLPGAKERKSVRRKMPTGDSGAPEMTVAAKTRRKPGSTATTIPEPKLTAARTVTDAALKPKAKRARTVTEAKSEPTPAKTVQPVKPGAKRATTDLPKKDAAKRSATAPKVNAEVTDSKAEEGAKRGAKPATTDPGLKRAVKRATTEQEVKPRTKRAIADPGLKLRAKPTKTLRD